MDWQREETENLILSVDKLKKEKEQLQDKIDKLQNRLKNLKGEVLTAEQAKAVEIKKAPLGMALLKYKDAVDLKKTAERVEKADKIISEEWNIISRAVKKAEKETQKTEQALKEKQDLLERYLTAIDELKKTYSSLLNSERLIREWREEESKRGLISRETLLKNAETIKREFEEDKDSNQSKNHSQSQGRRGRR